MEARPAFALAPHIVMLSMLGVLSGCCCRGPLPVSDKIESFAVVGFYSAPKTVIGRKRYAAETAPFDPVEVWVYLCYHNQQDQPIPEREIALSIVDAFGEPAGGPQLSSAAVMTNNLGLNDQRVLFDPRGKAGVYRVRADYPDKRARAIGYSPPITVLSEAN